MDRRVGRWRLRLRQDGPDLAQAFALRAATFRGGACDRDAFDAGSRHLTIETGGTLAGYARVAVQDRAAMLAGYAARTYDLSPLRARRAVELGRVCLAPGEPDLPRLLLAALAGLVDAEGADLLYGCASFPPDARGALAGLRGHVAEGGPRRRAADAIDLPRGGTGPLPPLLRLYLAFGARMSDHAVIDRDLGTVHVLAMLRVADIPPHRLRHLGALAPVPAEG